MVDGREPSSGLVEALWQALEIDPRDPQAPQRIKALVVEPDFGAAGFARLAPVVDRLAQQGDARAAAILARNAEALAAMVAAVAAALDLQAPPVCALGGALLHLVELRRQFAAKLARRLGRNALVSPDGDACQGALQLAADCLPDRARAMVSVTPTALTPGSTPLPQPDALNLSSRLAESIDVEATR
jgi:N-acetylglucosamine kinase-like BadF-type ATPase